MPGNPVVGSTVLRRPAIQSPNYVAGSTGWAIFSDGSAEFNGVTLRGNLTVGDSGEPQVVIESVGGIGEINFPTGSSVEVSAAQIAAAALLSGAAEFLAIDFKGGISTGAADQAYIQLNSNNAGGSASANGNLNYADTGATDHTVAYWDSAGFHVAETLYGTGGTLSIGDNISATGKAITCQSVTTAGDAQVQGAQLAVGNGSSAAVVLNPKQGVNAAATHISTTPTSAEFNSVVDLINSIRSAGINIGFWS
jgi:hypothetical protein